jgi:hypothetical protein
VLIRVLIRVSIRVSIQRLRALLPGRTVAQAQGRVTESVTESVAEPVAELMAGSGSVRVLVPRSSRTQAPVRAAARMSVRVCLWVPAKAQTPIRLRARIRSASTRPAVQARRRKKQACPGSEGCPVLKKASCSANTRPARHHCAGAPHQRACRAGRRGISQQMASH